MFIETHICKSIPSLDGYFASDKGYIFSMKSGKPRRMKTYVKDKYSCITLCSKSYKVNRLVAAAWIPNPDDLPIVNHKDGLKWNDNYLNLEWVTKGDDNKHSRDVLGNKPYSRPVCQTTMKGELIAKYKSITEAAKVTGISAQCIGGVCSGKGIQSKGFGWVYEEKFNKGRGVRKRSYRPVDKFDLEGNFVERFDSVSEAAQSVGMKSVSGISGVCKGRRKTCGGYFWKHAKIELKDETKDWVVLKQFPFDKISRDGRIYSLHLKRVKKQSTNNGYKSVYMRKAGGGGRYVKVHQLVAMAYIPNPRKVPVPNHKDGNRSNNTVENLEWNTYSENTIHAHDTGLIKTRKPVIQLDLENKKLCRFKSIAEAARMTKVNETSISFVCNGKQKTSGGFKWKFA